MLETHLCRTSLNLNTFFVAQYHMVLLQYKSLTHNQKRPTRFLYDMILINYIVFPIPISVMHDTHEPIEYHCLSNQISYMSIITRNQNPQINLTQNHVHMYLENILFPLIKIFYIGNCHHVPINDFDHGTAIIFQCFCHTYECHELVGCPTAFVNKYCEHHKCNELNLCQQGDPRPCVVSR